MIVSRLTPPAPGVVVLAISGELDLSSADALRGEVRDALAADTRYVIFDLSGLHFIDSSGLRGLEQCREDASELGAKIAVVRASRAALKLLSITGMHVHWPDYDTADDAVAGLGRSQ